MLDRELQQQRQTLQAYYNEVRRFEELKRQDGLMQDRANRDKERLREMQNQRERLRRQFRDSTNRRTRERLRSQMESKTRDIEQHRGTMTIHKTNPVLEMDRRKVLDNQKAMQSLQRNARNKDQREKEFQSIYNDVAKGKDAGRSLFELQERIAVTQGAKGLDKFKQHARKYHPKEFKQMERAMNAYLKREYDEIIKNPYEYDKDRMLKDKKIDLDKNLSQLEKMQQKQKGRDKVLEANRKQEQKREQNSFKQMER